MSRIKQLTGAPFTPTVSKPAAEPQAKRLRPDVNLQPAPKAPDAFQPSRPPLYACVARSDDKPTVYACVARSDDKPSHYACAARVDDGRVFEPPQRQLPGIDVRLPELPDIARPTDCFPDLPAETKPEAPVYRCIAELPRPPITDCFPGLPTKPEAPTYRCIAELPREETPVYACRAELPLRQLQELGVLKKDGQE